MSAHPSRGLPWFEAVKKSIAAQLGMVYKSPSSIQTPAYKVIEYDDDGKETFNGERQEEIVEGVEAMAGGSKTMAEEMLKKMSFKVSPPGSLNAATGGPVAGKMPADSGWVKVDLG